jgi:hypothetical protein
MMNNDSLGHWPNVCVCFRRVWPRDVCAGCIVSSIITIHTLLKQRRSHRRRYLIVIGYEFNKS